MKNGNRIIERNRVRTGGRLPSLLAVTLFAATGLGLMSAYPRTGSTHEPITTKVMFNKEVIRILEENCLGCHSPGRIKADIPLTTYDEARPWAKAIKEEVLEKRMMPYQAVRGYGHFAHDYSMPQREVDMLVSWIEGGAPRGDIKDYPENLRKLVNDTPNAPPVWESGKPDIVLQPAAPIRIGAEDESKCLALPVTIAGDRSIRGFEFQPGNGTVVKSAEFFIADGNYQGGCQEGSGVEMLGNWVPGQSGILFPGDGVFRLPKGSKVMLKLNYAKNGEEATDQSRLALYLSGNNGGKTTRNLVVKSGPVQVSANAANHRIKSTITIDEPTEALAIRPLIFPYAKSLEATAFLPDGRAEVLIWVRNYRFDWQPTYYFRNPVTLPKGTKIVLTAYLDNSESNRNLPTDPSSPLRFDGELCRLVVAENISSRQAMR